MHLHDINNLLNLQEITVTDYLFFENQSLILTVQPVSFFQNCPCCGSNNQVISDGKRYKNRRIRHLDCLGYHPFISLLVIRLFCKACYLLFTYPYSVVHGKARYTQAFKQKIAVASVRITIKH